MIFNMILTQLKSVALPSVVGGLAYNGNAQSPSYNAETMTVSGDISKTDVGTYTMLCKPKNGFEWPDGTCVAKPIEWEIVKANATISMNAGSTSYLWNDAPTLNFTLSKFGDGTVSAVSSNTSLATVALSGDTVTVSRADAVTQGNVTITLSISGTDNCNAATATYNFIVNTTYTWKKYNTISDIWFSESWGDLERVDERTEGGKRLGSNSYKFDNNTGEFSLVDPESGKAGAYTYSESGYYNVDIYRYDHQEDKSSGKGCYVYGYAAKAIDKSTYSCGSYITDVTTPVANAYPDNGKHTDGYWYVKQS